MKLQVELDGKTCILDLQQNGTRAEYVLRGVLDASGAASIAEITPGVFSILLGKRSFTVHVIQRGAQLEVWTRNRCYTISIADPRDPLGTGEKISAAGPVEIRAQMPGKVIKLLVTPGDRVEAGQGVIVIEAMKMQNEMKAPKDGIIGRVLVEEGGTVAAGETLVVVE